LYGNVSIHGGGVVPHGTLIASHYFRGTQYLHPYG